MSASEAQILANRRNSALSTGPTSIQGKERSRAIALKHGLTGAGVVLTNEDALEVERTFVDLEAELRPSGTVGRALVRRVATCIVRMERSVLQESAALSERVIKAEAEAERDGLVPVDAGRRAMFDPSREATLARKYEAASERGMYRALKEFRQLQREPKAPDLGAETASIRKQIGQLASFLPADKQPPAAVTPPRSSPKPATPVPQTPSKTVLPA